MDLPLFVSRFMLAFYIDLVDPLHWMSKHQKVTAASSAEAEIYAADKWVKFLLELIQILDFLEVKEIFMPTTHMIYNDNAACIEWLKSTTTKGLRHIQMWENHARENIASKFVSIQHASGKICMADIFIKKMKDTAHLLELWDCFIRQRLDTCYWVFLIVNFHISFPLQLLFFEGGVNIISNTFIFKFQLYQRQNQIR
jgi:hypothetical protein